MTHGLRCWNSNGFLVIDMNSDVFAIVSAGGANISVPPSGGSVDVTVPFPNKSKYLGRDRIIVSSNAGVATGTDWYTTELSSGYRITFYTYSTNPSWVSITAQYWVVLR